MNNESKRGKLIKQIVSRYVEENIFNNTVVFKESLQDELNKNLSFETQVSDIETKHCFNTGYIHFKNEDGVHTIIDFVITNENEKLFEFCNN